MRKFFVYLFAFLMIFFLLPALLTNRGEVSASVKEENTRKEDNLEQENTNTEELKIVCNLIKNGELVIFPTETVYGIGADATNDKAVEKIFKAK